MAIIEHGINGGFTGKAGSVTGYYLNGKWVMRGIRKRSKKNKKGTEKQRACRKRFSEMQKFLSPIIPVVRIGFNMESKKRMMTAHNVAKSYNMLNAQNLEGEIDYPNVCLTYGKIIGVENPQVTIDGTSLHFSWTNNTGSDHIRAYDQVMLIAYNVTNGVVVSELSGAKRRACAETLTINKIIEQTYHVWISFISDDRQDIAMSTYCGSFTI